MDKHRRMVHSLFSRIAGRYDMMNTILSLNLDKYWRRKALEIAAPNPGEQWLDVCCGTGKLTLAIRRILGHEGEVVGLDFTPSMLAVEDAIFALEWAKGIGGLAAMKCRADANAAALDAIVQARGWLGHLAADPASRSNTSVCLTVEGADAGFIKKFAALLEQEGAAYDIAGYRDAPAGLRIWCGATVDAADVEALGPWLDWAYAALNA